MPRQKNTSPTFVLIGAGNLASHLASVFIEKGFVLKQVIGRKEARVKSFAEKFQVAFTVKHGEIDSTADYYIFCVSDDSLHELAKHIRLDGKLVMHTSGSVPMSVLKAVSSSYAVLYPLYTFSADDQLDFKDVPVFVEASDEKTLRRTKQIARMLSENVMNLSSQKRERLHLAAVMTANFSNYLYTLAAEYLEDEKAPDFKLLLPLIRKTAQKLEKRKPSDAQTGPAKRNDKKVIARHKQMLSGYPELLKVYSLLSSGIQKRYNKK